MIIWNNGDGNDINEGDAGVDETLITEGIADDGNACHAERRDHALRRASSAGVQSLRSTPMEKLSLHVLLGQRHADHAARACRCGMNIDAGPGDDIITTGDGADRIVGDRGDDTSTAPAATTRSSGPTATATTS